MFTHPVHLISIECNNNKEQEMSYDTYAPLTLTFDLVTPKSKGSSTSHDQPTCEI